MKTGLLAGVGGAEWLLVSLVVVGVAIFWRRHLLDELALALRVNRFLVLILLADDLWATVATVWSDLPGRGLAEAARCWLTSASILVFAVAVRNRARARMVLIPVVLVGCAVGLAAVIASFLSRWHVGSSLVDAGAHSEIHAWSRAQGPFGTPATFGAMMLGLLGVASVARSYGVLGMRAFQACLAIGILGGIASASIPGAACAVLLPWLLLGRRHPRAMMLVVAALLLGATGIIYAHLHSVQAGAWRWDRPIESGYQPLGPGIHPIRRFAIGGLAIEYHFTGYARIHAAHGRVVVERPLGVGTGAFPTVDTGPTLRTNGKWARSGHPHAWALMRASEGGVVGGVVAGLLLALACLGIVRLLGKSAAGANGTNPHDSAFGLAVLVSGLFVWASWFGDFLHRWDVALIVGGVLAGRAPSVEAVASTRISAPLA